METGFESLSKENKIFVLGFDSAIKAFTASIDGIETEDVVNGIACFRNALEDMKFFIKDYVLDDMTETRKTMINEMLDEFVCESNYDDDFWGDDIDLEKDET